jgi:phospholipase C
VTARSLTLAILALLAVASGAAALTSTPGARASARLPARPAAVTFLASDANAVPGERVTFAGRLRAAHAGERVRLQELRGSGWRTVASTRLGASAGFSFRRMLPTGSFAFRAAPAVAGASRNTSLHSAPVTVSVSAIHKIKHVVIIMQENRSFDHYFGTFPGADGIPGLAGNPGSVPCLPDPVRGHCYKPFHDRSDENFGANHGLPDALADMDCSNQPKHKGCRMDGFAAQAEKSQNCSGTNPRCGACKVIAYSKVCPDVMGYHTGQDIPNYWSYARNFVLQDHMFEPATSWSLPAHLFMVSEWSAMCSDPYKPSSCRTDLRFDNQPKGGPQYAWTDITYLLHRSGVSWGYYVFHGTEPDCELGQATCKPVSQGAQAVSIWNPLPAFTDVVQDGQTGNIKAASAFVTAAKAGTLPAVSWIVPSDAVSEHPPRLVSKGQEYVTGLIDTIMESPDWKSTAIFLAWDDWGGFYDQAVPPAVDANGYGIRVPAMVISPYAKRGHIDPQTLSFDAYNKFIEDEFLSGERLNPSTDGRPDPRPDVREASPLVGNLASDFNFSRRPRSPTILPVCPATDLLPKPTC